MSKKDTNSKSADYNQTAAAEMASTSPELSMKMMKALGVNDCTYADGKLDLPCTGTEGIVYIQPPTGGAKVPLAFEDEGRTMPMRCSCEHQGFELIAGYLKSHIMLFTVASLVNPEFKMPEPEDFCYVPTEDKTEDVEINSTEQADAVIDFVKGLTS